MGSRGMVPITVILNSGMAKNDRSMFAMMRDDLHNPSIKIEILEEDRAPD